MNKLFSLLVLTCFSLNILHAGLVLNLEQREHPLKPASWAYRLELSDTEMLALAKEAHDEIYQITPGHALERTRETLLNMDLPDNPQWQETRTNFMEARPEDKAKYDVRIRYIVKCALEQVMMENLPYANAIELLRSGKIDETTFRYQVAKRIFLQETINKFILEVNDIIFQAALEVVAEKNLDANYPLYQATAAEKAQMKKDLNRNEPVSAREFFDVVRRGFLNGSDPLSKFITTIRDSIAFVREQLPVDVIQSYPDDVLIKKFYSLLSELKSSQSNPSAQLEHKIDTCVYELVKFNIEKHKKNSAININRMKGIRALAILSDKHDNNDAKEYAAALYFAEVQLEQLDKFVSSLKKDLNDRAKNKAGFLMRMARALGLAK